MYRKTITVIGGGSVNWMRTLMRDVYLVDELEGGEIRLVDPNTEHVEAVADMLRAFNKIRGKDYKISTVPNRREALDGADFVISTFSPGAMDGFWNDLEIPKKYGIIQPVSMTVGPCGISAAIRTAPVAYEIIRDMEEMCPGAWMLNVTNPMSVVVRAMSMAAHKTKVIGLCHELHCIGNFIGPILGLPKQENDDVLDYIYRWLPEQGLDFTVAGVNHFIWITQAALNGEDAIPVIRKYCEDNRESPEYTEPDANPYWNRNAVKFAFCRQFGYLPLVGDRHLVEFYPSLCNPRNGYGMKYKVCKTSVDARKFSKYKELEEIRSVTEGKTEVSWKRTGEEMVEIMKAILNNTPTPCIVNIPNRGQITNLPKDSVVETFATVTAGGVEPKMSGDMPGSVGTLCRLHVDIHELTVKAALEGDRKLLIEALSLDPSSGCADFSEIPDLADELLLANKEWLPRFF